MEGNLGRTLMWDGSKLYTLSKIPEKVWTRWLQLYLDYGLPLHPMECGALIYISIIFNEKMDLNPWGFFFYFNHDFWPFWYCQTIKPYNKIFIKHTLLNNIYKSVFNTKTFSHEQKFTLSNERKLGAIIIIVWSKEQWNYMNEEPSPLIAVHLHGAGYCSAGMLRQTHQSKWISGK